MKKINDHQLKVKIFYSLLGEARLRHEKENILDGYGVSSAKDLSAVQLDELITWLRGIIQRNNEAPLSLRRKRSNVLTLLEMLGVYKAEDPQRWVRVNNYLKDPRIAGKLMYELDEEELGKLTKKLRAIHALQVKKIQEENFVATQN